MTYRRLAAWIVALILTIVPAAQASAHPARVILLQPGPAFCSSHTVMFGNIVIPQGRCFTVFLLRSAPGSFLVFVPPGTVLIPPGQFVRLGTPVAAQIMSRAVVLLPLPFAVAFIPINSLGLVVVRIEDLGSRLFIGLPEGPATVLVFPSPQKLGASLPDDVQIFPPSSDVPQDEAAFAGKWAGEFKGKWRGLVEGGLPHVLVVEEIRQDNLTGKTIAIVVFAWGTATAWGISSGWYRVRGTFERGALRLTLPSNAQITYRMSFDGTLDATYERADFGVLQAMMKRIPESAVSP